MKWTVHLFLWMSLLAEAPAQGTLLFDNRRLSGPTGFYDAYVSFPDGTRVGGNAFTTGLFAVEPAELRLVATTTFRDTPNGLGLFIPSVVTVPGVAAQSSATFRVRVWETGVGSYDAAVALGKLYGEFATGQPYLSHSWGHFRLVQSLNPILAVFSR